MREKEREREGEERDGEYRRKDTHPLSVIATVFIIVVLSHPSLL